MCDYHVVYTFGESWVHGAKLSSNSHTERPTLLFPYVISYLHSTGLGMVRRLLYSQVTGAPSSAPNDRRSSAPMLAMLPTLAPEPLALSPFPELPYLFAMGRNRHHHDHHRHQQSADTFHAPQDSWEVFSQPVHGSRQAMSMVSGAPRESCLNHVCSIFDVCVHDIYFQRVRVEFLARRICGNIKYDSIRKEHLLLEYCSVMQTLTELHSGFYPLWLT